jgi:flavin-binding protein dodecin
MPGTYKTIELVGTSPVSFAEAVKAAVADASATVRHMDWFEQCHAGDQQPSVQRMDLRIRGANRGTAGPAHP